MIQNGTLIRFSNCSAIIKEFLASGGSAHVYRASIPNSKNALNLVAKHVICFSPAQTENAEREARVHANLVHNCIVRFVDYAKIPGMNGTDLIVLMEECPLSLLQILQSQNTTSGGQRKSSLSENDILYILYDVTLALAHLHTQVPAIAHRDIKIENILACPISINSIRYN